MNASDEQRYGGNGTDVPREDVWGVVRGAGKRCLKLRGDAEFLSEDADDGMIEPPTPPYVMRRDVVELECACIGSERACYAEMVESRSGPPMSEAAPCAPVSLSPGLSTLVLSPYLLPLLL
eukprot:7450060-Pyramimonas_sp.AAC.1